jgi:hypothetical protein
VYAARNTAGAEVIRLTAVLAVSLVSALAAALRLLQPLPPLQSSAQMGAADQPMATPFVTPNRLSILECAARNTDGVEAIQTTVAPDVSLVFAQAAVFPLRLPPALPPLHGPTDVAEQDTVMRLATRTEHLEAAAHPLASAARLQPIAWSLRDVKTAALMMSARLLQLHLLLLLLLELTVAVVSALVELLAIQRELSADAVLNMDIVVRPTLSAWLQTAVKTDVLLQPPPSLYQALANPLSLLQLEFPQVVPLLLMVPAAPEMAVLFVETGPKVAAARHTDSAELLLLTVVKDASLVLA